MIRITQQYNIKCLRCDTTPEKLVKIGAFYMCRECFEEEFAVKMKELKKFDGIDPKSKLGEVYHKWLKIYFKEEEEYFDTITITKRSIK